MTLTAFPLGYEVFAGNTHDSQTLADDRGHDGGRGMACWRVWIADRGMASADNLAWLR